jgi:hypothetical protein
MEISMIAQEKIPAALYAIHRILVQARFFVGEGVDPKKLYTILDCAEILPTLITCREEDTTEEFREMLAGLGEQYPEFSGHLGNFDKDISWNALAQSK